MTTLQGMINRINLCLSEAEELGHDRAGKVHDLALLFKSYEEEIYRDGYNDAVETIRHKLRDMLEED